MARVRSANTTPELVVRRALHAAGLRYRLGGRGLPGKPDLVFPGRRVALFVHGCFWHRHPGCKEAMHPVANHDYWSKKFTRNVERDARVKRELEELGWTVLVIWECETRRAEALRRLADMLLAMPAPPPPAQAGATGGIRASHAGQDANR